MHYPNKWKDDQEELKGMAQGKFNKGAVILKSNCTRDYLRLTCALTSCHVVVKLAPLSSELNFITYTLTLGFGWHSLALHLWNLMNLSLPMTSPHVVALESSTKRHFSLVDLTVDIPSTSQAPSSLTERKNAARWKTLEFKFYWIALALALPLMIWVPMSLSTRMHMVFRGIISCTLMLLQPHTPITIFLGQGFLRAGYSVVRWCVLLSPSCSALMSTNRIIATPNIVPLETIYLFLPWLLSYFSLWSTYGTDPTCPPHA